MAQRNSTAVPMSDQCLSAREESRRFLSRGRGDLASTEPVLAAAHLARIRPPTSVERLTKVGEKCGEGVVHHSVKHFSKKPIRPICKFLSQTMQLLSALFVFSIWPPRIPSFFS